MLHGINPNDPKSAIQQLVVAVNRILMRMDTNQGIGGAGGVAPDMRHGWLGVVRDEGPGGESGFDDGRYWVEMLEADGSTDDASDAILSAIAITDRDSAAAPGGRYIVATNLSEVTYTDGGGDVTSNGGGSVTAGTPVRVFTVHTPGEFNYFWIGGGLGTFPVRLTVDIGSLGLPLLPSMITYTAYKFTNPTEIPPTGTIIGSGYVALNDIFGDQIEIITGAKNGIGCYDTDGNFVLLSAVDPIYVISNCAPPG